MIGRFRSLKRIVKNIPKIRMYQIQSGCGDKQTSRRVVDLRSDTITKPSQTMRLAMQNALVGDDVCREDPTVNALEKRCAELFGTEAALFVATGSMANLIAIMAHCNNRRDSEIIIGDKTHIHKHEQGSYAIVGGVSASVLPNNDDGTMSLENIENAIRDHSDCHEPKTQLICLENTHNNAGGRVLPLDYHKKVYEFAQKIGIKVHIDGARLMNACLALGVKPKDIAQYADSVCMCFSKGLGAPVGSIVCGSQEFIDKALRVRKLLGGGWRQAGVLAAPALVALDVCEQQLKIDHDNAKILAKGIHSLNSQFASVDLNVVETNFVMVKTSNGLTAPALCDSLGEADDEDDVAVLCYSIEKHKVRLVTHCDVSSDDIKMAIEKFKRVLTSFNK